MAVAVFIAGATLASISPVSLALQGVVTPKHDYSRSNAIYNAFYAAGMLFGPPVSSVLFRRFGGAGMLYHLAALWMGFVAFATIFAADDPAHHAGLTEGRTPASS
jgi:MFS family permease